MTEQTDDIMSTDTALSTSVERSFDEQAIRGIILDPRRMNYWDRQPDEPAQSFEWFLVYRDMHRAERGIAAARNKTREIELDLDIEKHYRYARMYRWKERALEWDRCIDKMDQAKWARRGLILREKEWDLATELIKKAEAMLKFPLTRVRQESDNGKTITIIEPADWRFSDINRVIAGASHLARLAANMDTSKLKLSVEDLDRVIENELAQLTAGDEGGVSEEDSREEGFTNSEDE